MGRELKRVALDFDWPIDKTWDGYLNPFYKHCKPCPFCESGYSREAAILKDKWYGNAPFKPEDRGSVPYPYDHPIVMKRAMRNSGTGDAADATVIHEAKRLASLFNSSWSHHLNADDVAALIASGRLMDFTHEWTGKDGWVEKIPAVIPTPQQVNDWSIDFGMGHDSCNQWAVVKAECERLGYETQCNHCHGSGEVWETPEFEQQSESWTRVEPPAGEGYQAWQTVSEGSPISPVFATPEELATHMATTRWGADKGSSYETWMNFICGNGWAMSMVIDSNGARSGVEALYSNDVKKEVNTVL